MSEIEEHVNVENWSSHVDDEPNSIRLSPESSKNIMGRHLKRLKAKKEELEEEKGEIEEKSTNTDSRLLAGIYEKRVEQLSDKIEIINYQIDATNRKIIAKQEKKSRPIKVKFGMFSRIYGAYRFAKRLFGKIKNKIYEWNKKADDYAGINSSEDDVDVYEESNQNGDEIRDNIEQGFANMEQQEEKNEPVEETKAAPENTTDVPNAPVVDTPVVEENNAPEVPRPRDREVYETDDQYVNHLKDFYSKQFPNIDVENSRVNASHIDTSEGFNTADDVINQVVGITQSPATRRVEPIQIAEERPYMNNSVYNTPVMPTYDSNVSMKSESDELRQLRDKLKELNDLISGKQQSVASRQAHLTEQEKNIVAQEQKNEELYARVNELLMSKKEKIERLTAEEMKAQQRGQTLDERQAQVMQEQEALERMLNEGSSQDINTNSFRM